MTFVIPYDYCSEQEESLSQLVRHKLREYERSTDPVRRDRLAFEMRTIEAASNGHERSLITPLLNGKHVKTFKVVYEQE